MTSMEKPERISKIMAARGLCSRREADEFIQKGWVLLDGHPVTTLGTKMLASQTVSLSPQALRHSGNQLTILLNKPVGYVSGQPENNHRHALSLITRAQCAAPETIAGLSFPIRNLAPAGRLDIDSQGLLVFTQDGRVARQLIGADSLVEKEYLVRVEGNIQQDMITRLQSGLSLDGKRLKPAQVVQLHPQLLQFILKEGRKRQIRRMCDLVGLKVVGLKRVRIGGVRLGRLPLGTWRLLTPEDKFIQSL